MMDFQIAMQQRLQFHQQQQQQRQQQMSSPRPVGVGMACYTVPECTGDGEGDDDDAEDKWNGGTFTTSTTTTTTTEDDFDDDTPVTSPAATIGAYHPPPGNGPPQLGYFVPLTPVFFRSPQFRKRDTIDSNRSRRSTSYCGSVTPTPVNNGSSRRSSLVCTSPSLASTIPPPIPELPNKSAITRRQSSIDYTANSNSGPKNVNYEKFSDSKFSVLTSNFTNPTSGNFNGDGSGIADRAPKGENNTSPYSYLNPKRYSSPPFSDFAYDKGVNVKNRSSSIIRSKSKKEQRNYHSMNETIEVLADQVVEDDSINERTSWDYSTVSLSRVPGYGFGIAVSGGRDNPHFANGDPSIAVSDVLKHGPAEGQLQVNDRIISVNGISLENVEYATAVQVLRDSGNTVTLVVKRRVPNHSLMQPAGGVGVTNSHQHQHQHQHQHSLSSTGLGLGALAANNGSQQQIKVIVTKANKKDDFGIVLGCRLFIKEISSKTKDQLAANGYSLQEGDLVTRIHNTNCNDSMSLKEAKKIIDGCKERLTLAVLRDATNSAGLGGGTSSGMQSPVYSHTAQVSNCSNMDENYLNGNGGSYSGQNLYVQPPTRLSAMSTLLVDDKSNLTPRGRSRGPLTDISLQQLDRPSTPPGATSSRGGEGSGHMRSRSIIDEPPRPPPPRGEDFYSTRRPLHDDKISSEPRYITFQKEGSVGIRLSGGNEVGIFVTAVQQNSPAAAQGLVPGDKILKVNDMDMNGVTREEAVLFLLSLQDRIDLIVQYCKEEYDNVTQQQRGDSFHIKTHFHCENPSKGELAFKAGDVFRVIDTLYNGVVGAWQVLRIGHGHQELQRGVIPNKARAEELATAQFNATKKEMNASESRVSFFRRRRSTHRRSKSLSRENWDDVVFSDSISKFPAYERVVLRHPGFVRPVVLFGPVSDIARERLIKDFSDKYTAPLQDDDKGSSKCGGIVRLSNIRDIMDRGKHALLDITPNAVDRLNYAQFYPVVIFLKADTKHCVKQLRHGLPKSQHKSSKKLFEQCQKLERVWSHIFSTTINLNDPDTWYRKLRDSIDQQQSGAVWMSETKPVESLSDDFLFPMTTSRLSYASSPESDLELSPGPSASLSLGNLPQLVKSSSDPSIATNQDNLDRDRELGDGMPPPYTNPYDHSGHPRRMTVDNKYGFSANKSNIGAPMPPEDAIYGSRPPPPIQHNNTSHFGPVPDLPPRIDRASKPPNATTTPSTPASSLPSRNSSTGGTLGRSAQERLFGNSKSSTDNLDQAVADDYATRSQMLGQTPDKRAALSNGLNSLERVQNTSLDRSSRPNQLPPQQQPPPQMPPGATSTPGKANGSYDSVSSYDSYNATQLTAQNMRLGPNAPDDLKSVPNRGGTGLTPNQSTVSDYNRTTGSNDLLMTPPRGSHLHPDRNNLNGNHEPLTQRNSGDRPTGMNIPQRPSNLALESPRKHVMETKTDYGKYSRNNSASQADYSKPNKMAPPMLGTPPSNGPNGMPFKPVPPPKPKNYRPPIGGGGGGGSGTGSNGGPMNSGQWDNGESISPRSPNGFYYPPMSSHYHQGVARNVPSSPNNNHMNAPPPVGHPSQMHHPYGGAGSGVNPGQYGPNAYNGYNGNNGGGQPHYMGNSGRDMGMGHNNAYNGNTHHPYGNNYMHRGSGGPNHGIGNMSSLHPSERHPLDLAGSREQRGSAFELYRKPQLGTAGHHHNMREMEPMMSIHEYNQHQQNLMYQERMRQQQPLPPIPGSVGYDEYSGRNVPHSSLPPELPAKPPKKNILKSPLKAIKNVFIKSTRPLRRQVSLAESDRKLRPILKRQHSMMEPRSARMMDTRFQDPQYDSRQYYMQQQQQQQQHHQQQQYYNDPRHQMSPPPQHMRQYQRHEPYYPKDPNSTYQNLESESIYGNYGGGSYYDHEQENLYANRALIELERPRPGLGPGSGSQTTGRRIVRRHSMADRSVPSPSFNHFNRRRMGSERYHMDTSGGMNEESIYQSKSGSYMYNEARDPTRRHYVDPVYQSRREMHRDHLYQSKQQMQDRIQQSRLEMIQNQHRERSESPGHFSRTKDATESSSSSPNSPASSTYSTRKEMKEKGIKPRTQLRDQIYQSRREAMESMAEPDYVSRRELKHEPIYESKNETDITSSMDMSKLQISENKHNLNIEQDDSVNKEAEANVPTQTEDQNIQESIEDSSKAPLALSEEDDEDDTLTKTNESDLQKATSSKPSTPLTSRSTHISNFLKRTGPPPPPPDTRPPPPPVPTITSHNVPGSSQMKSPPPPEVYASRTSIETQYTSQMSLPIGPPNATSTPFVSEMSLGLPPPRQPITRRGVFDSTGGTLSDPIWNVSLQIPAGAIAPGIKQEIYFTVTDPRLSESVGGPPLDMENGETMLSPLVMCGPQGTEFLLPVTLNIPHCAGRTASLGLSLKATDSEKNLQTDWDNIELPSNVAAHTVSVKVDHF
ncbi:tight junction protein ZO-1 isoform X3 [Uranotaenia lowii]|uniref:tight junction protein ZO-1 isoform X3 n=1 Tax=Uranotaenia lowii TaxID=190385 RepID=UPI002479C892|nr:tight junction protein ZO-1 isoform X3 [Uranotaenia lowii]